jgi:predicted metal-dependent peptidase
MTFSTRTQLTAEQRVSKALVNIIDHRNYIALAGVLMMGSKEVRDDVPTACTNGRDEWYGREFVDSLTDPELRFLILHECYHKLYRHLTTWKHLHDKDHRLANIACDHVINLQILSDKSVNDDGTLFVEMPRCKETGQLMGLADTRFSDMNSEQVFNILYAEQEEQQQSGESEQGDGEGFDDHDWEGAESMSDEEQQQLAEQIDTAIRQGALTAGKVGSGGNRAIDSLLQPEINWVDVLSEFVTETCRGTDYSTYARPNRRYMSAGM